MGKKIAGTFPGAPSAAQIEFGRRGLAMTQAEAAALAMVSQSTWAGWEAGVRPMHPWIWSKWVELAPAEGKRLRPYFFVNPQPATSAPAPVNESPGDAMRKIGGECSPKRAAAFEEIIAKYGLTDADCLKAFPGFRPEEWLLLRKGFIMDLGWNASVLALQTYAEAEHASRLGAAIPSDAEDPIPSSDEAI